MTRSHGGQIGKLVGVNGQRMGWQELVQNGQFWALAGQVGLGGAPFATFASVETARIRMFNDTISPHAMHLHGMHFRVRKQDGTLGPMRDTVPVLPKAHQSTDADP